MMRILDLYCGVGGAGHGYWQAGYDVVGVDLQEQPRYPHAFLRANVLTLDQRFLRSFDMIHASPPCQAHTALKHAKHGKQHLDLIPETRALLQASGVPYVIENVPGAPLIDPVTLCGSMFGLGVKDSGVWHQLRRHRLFETSWGLKAPACRHQGAVVGVYGGHARRRSAKHGGRGTKDTWELGHQGAAKAAMGMDWATATEISQAVPPAYTEFIGQQFRRYATRAA